MGVLLKFNRNVVLYRAFDSDDILTRCNTCPVSDPENMRVDGLGRKFEPHVQDNIRRLSTNAGQRL